MENNNDNRIFVAGPGGSPFQALQLASQLLSDSSYMQLAKQFRDFYVPKHHKENRVIGQIMCNKCGSTGTLKKINDNEYKCLKCSKEGSYNI